MIVAQTLLDLFILHLFVVCACAIEHGWCSEIERGSWFFLPFYHLRPGDQTQVRLDCKHLYLLVYLPCPLMSLKSSHWGIISAL